jgi:hypothetical protein
VLRPRAKDRFHPRRVDQHGTIVLKHFGEGHYDEMEAAIQSLLARC